MPAGSKMDPLLAKAKPISASVITYLRRRKTLRERELLQPERGVRRCKKLCRHQESSWKSGEAPDDWKKANVAKTFKKGYGKGVEVSLTSGPGQIVVRGLLARTSGQIKEEVTGNRLNGFTKGKSCLTNQIAFLYKTGFVGETRETGLGKAVDVT
ncbi:mitochondrial enolase superfamily member 1 [Grus japonensis]|uniref:Mitochondrial enolase superfamily member 1 n=1 Tax=Grus japonensis TaxID=30415 RepID=A0ABC9WK49_GRUJA